MNSRNTITIRNQVYERLKRHGAFGESFSKLITRILDELERDKKKIEAENAPRLLDLLKERKRLEQERRDGDGHRERSHCGTTVSRKKTLQSAPSVGTIVQTATAENPFTRKEMRHG